VDQGAVDPIQQLGGAIRGGIEVTHQDIADAIPVGVAGIRDGVAVVVWAGAFDGPDLGTRCARIGGRKTACHAVWITHEEVGDAVPVDVLQLGDGPPEVAA
jgi:hypothetical protein